MLNRLVALSWLLFMAVTSALFFCLCLLVWLLTVCFDRRLWLVHYLTCCWGALYVWLFPFWHLRITGKQLFQDSQAHVIVSNHQSQLDILIALCLFKHFKWVSKAEIFLVPFVGWNMYLNRYIRLRRGHQDSIRRMYSDCIAALQRGSSVFLFPEGTRSLNGSIGNFKPGAFSIAKRAGVPILPVAITGTHDALPKKSLNFHGRHELHIQVLEPIPPETVAAAEPRQLAELARQRIIEAIGTGGPATKQ